MEMVGAAVPITGRLHRPGGRWCQREGHRHLGTSVCAAPTHPRAQPLSRPRYSTGLPKQSRGAWLSLHLDFRGQSLQAELRLRTPTPESHCGGRARPRCRRGGDTQNHGGRATQSLGGTTPAQQSLGAGPLPQQSGGQSFQPRRIIPKPQTLMDFAVICPAL